MFLKLKYLFNSKQINNFWICFSVQTINSVSFSRLLKYSYHQSEYRQKAKTDEAYRYQLFH